MRADGILSCPSSSPMCGCGSRRGEGNGNLLVDMEESLETGSGAVDNVHGNEGNARKAGFSVIHVAGLIVALGGSLGLSYLALRSVEFLIDLLQGMAG